MNFDVKDIYVKEFIVFKCLGNQTPTSTAELLSLLLAEKEHPNGDEKQDDEQGVLIELHLLFTNTFF